MSGAAAGLAAIRRECGLHALLEEAGLRGVRVHSRVKTLRFPSPEELVYQFIPGSPIAAAMGEVDESAIEAVVRDVNEALQPYLDDRGLAFPIENHLAQGAFTTGEAIRP